MKIVRRFELIGVPLQCWNDETIRNIRGTIGEVEDICYKKYNFSFVEIVVTDHGNPNHNLINIILVLHEGKEYRVFLTEISPILDDDDDIISLQNSSKDQNHQKNDTTHNEANNID